MNTSLECCITLHIYIGGMHRAWTIHAIILDPIGHSKWIVMDMLDMYIFI